MTIRPSNSWTDTALAILQAIVIANALFGLVAAGTIEVGSTAHLVHNALKVPAVISALFRLFSTVDKIGR